MLFYAEDCLRLDYFQEDRRIVHAGSGEYRANWTLVQRLREAPGIPGKLAAGILALY
jgi:hypothetical protein